MEGIKIQELANKIKEKRAGRGVRAVAKEVGISPATLSRIENAGLPDLATFSRVCRWLDEDPSVFLGLPPRATGVHARVHFKKGPTVRPESAKALANLIIAVQSALQAEDDEG